MNKSRINTKRRNKARAKYFSLLNFFAPRYIDGVINIGDIVGIKKTVLHLERLGMVRVVKCTETAVQWVFI